MDHLPYPGPSPSLAQPAWAYSHPASAVKKHNTVCKHFINITPVIQSILRTDCILIILFLFH